MEPVVYTPVSAAANLRRSIIVSVILGVAALIGTTVAGHPLMGMFACIGLALGAVNNRMLQKSVISYATAVQAGAKDATKGKFRGGVLTRLGVVTILALLAPIVSYPDGLGVVGGLAVFQVLMLVGAAVPVFRSLRWSL